jgi:3-hydroxyacyl-[acyl-carrier-protein] dehydratase
MSKLYDLNPSQIMKYQQNKFPLFFVDRITEVDPGKYALGYKNFTYNEWFFPTHFPDQPNVPGFIQIEVLVQVFLMTFLTIPEYVGQRTSFISITEAKFRKELVPGDKLEVHAILNSFKHGIAKGSVSSNVGSKTATTANFTVALPTFVKHLSPSG